ncbi:MAG TPA: hypothetical protein VJH23_05035 [archaeon]|nr:hypothetical protein [archaeon]
MTYSNSSAQKKIVLDSSTLITISDNCMMKVMKALSERENISFIIPESVYAESVQTPMKIRRFGLNAIRIRDAVEEGYVKIAKATPQTRQRLERLEQISQNLCTFNGEKMILLHLGEMETLALHREIGADALAIDERTTRMLIEEPEGLLSFLRKRHHGKIIMNTAQLGEFRREYGGIKIIRSTELISLAYSDGSFAEEIHATKQALEAALFAAKFGGCAVSFEEIKSYMGKIR